MIHDADPELKTLITIGGSFNLQTLMPSLADVDIVCIRNREFDPAEAEQLRQQGKEIWTYVSGPGPPYPTLVIDYPAMAARILPWMCWKFGIKGLLYWSVNPALVSSMSSYTPDPQALLQARAQAASLIVQLRAAVNP